MNAHIGANEFARPFGIEAPRLESPRPASNLAVDLLVATTALTSPAMIVATGWLYGGASGLYISVPIAAAFYAGITLNDLLLVRAAEGGAGQVVSLTLRGLLPIAGTTLLAVPLLLKLFGGDLDQIEAQRVRDAVAPVQKRIARQVDEGIEAERHVLGTMRAERLDLDARRAAAGRGFDASLAAEREAIAGASERVRAQQLVLRCEQDGLQCVEVSSGKKGLHGPVSMRAAALLRAATEELATREKRATKLEEDRVNVLGPMDGRLQVLTATSGAGSIAEAEAKVRALSSGRDDLIARRMAADPEVRAASAPTGLGGRLIALLTIVVQQPTILVVLFAAKVFVTVFELLGAVRGLRAARAARNEREGYADDSARAHAGRLQRLRRRVEYASERLVARRKLWELKRDLKNARMFDRFSGLEASLRSNTVAGQSG